MRMKWVALAMATAIIGLAGCRSAPVYNINNAAVVSNKPATLDGVSQAIVRAGNTLGWIMNADRPGHVLGTLHLREHTAVVDINYDEKSYSIKYKDSSNLNYDGQSIHSNYNGWVQNLDKAIKAQLSNM